MMVNNSKINKRFGRLLVIKEAKYSLSQVRKKELWYWCACDCGKKSHLVSNSNLKKRAVPEVVDVSLLMVKIKKRKIVI